MKAAKSNRLRSCHIKICLGKICLQIIAVLQKMKITPKTDITPFLHEGL